MSDQTRMPGITKKAVALTMLLVAIAMPSYSHGSSAGVQYVEVKSLVDSMPEPETDVVFEVGTSISVPVTAPTSLVGQYSDVSTVLTPMRIYDYSALVNPDHQVTLTIHVNGARHNDLGTQTLTVMRGKVAYVAVGHGPNEMAFSVELK